MKKFYAFLCAAGLLWSVNNSAFGYVIQSEVDISQPKAGEAVELELGEVTRQLYYDSWLELQRKFEDEVSEMVRIQDDFERNVILEAQNLSTKKHLTKKERKQLLASYRAMPKTVEEYKIMSKDIKRNQRKIGPAKLPQDAKLVKIPEPRYQIVKYNNPPGSQNIDLRNLVTERQVNSIGVISPKQDKIAYTMVYYAGYNDKVSSEVFYMDLDTSKPLKQRVKMASLANKTQIKLIDSAVKEEYPSLFKTMTIVDWSADGTKLALKERVGSSVFGVWQTNLWVYDLTAQAAKQLVEVRDAVKYWWKENNNVDIDEYRWDIVPIGWDEVNPDRVIVCAYGYTDKKTAKFLGLFSVDAKGRNSQMISAVPMSLNISTNGLVLKSIIE